MRYGSDAMRVRGRSVGMERLMDLLCRLLTASKLFHSFMISGALEPKEFRGLRRHLAFATNAFGVGSLTYIPLYAENVEMQLLLNASS